MRTMKRLAFYLLLIFAVSCTPANESVYEQELIRIDHALERADEYVNMKQQKISTQVMSGITVQTSAALAVTKKSMSNTSSRHPKIPNTASATNNTTPAVVEIFSIFFISMTVFV